MFDLQAGRKCGGCTACCRMYISDSLTPNLKSACKYVQHRGCPLYGQIARPSPCPQYSCGWLRGYGNERNRPDRTGVYFEVRKVDLFSGYTIILIWRDDRFDNDYLDTLLYDSLREGYIAAVITREEHVSLYVPDFITLTQGTRGALLAEDTEILSGSAILKSGVLADSSWLVAERRGAQHILVKGDLTYKRALDEVATKFHERGHYSCWMAAYAKGQLDRVALPMDLSTGLRLLRR